MSELHITDAAEIARGVYALRQDVNWNTLQGLGQDGIDIALKIDGQFSMRSERFKGTSGGNLLRTEAGFGYVAEGVGTRNGELLIGIRGTVTALDWVTDFAQGLEHGPSGHIVHGGFMRTFNSFEPTIAAYFRNNRSNPSTVHIVGHSLGGALATLTADYLKLRGLNVQLYTFGSPRVGTSEFSVYLTDKLKEENIFRVSNQSDPVTMVPIFPFLHVPHNSAQYLIPSWHGINPFNHFKDAYVSNVKGKDWQHLKNSAATKTWTEQTEMWLQSAGSNGSGIQMYSAKTLWMIMKALDWIIGKALGIVDMRVGLAALGVVTVLDQLTQILYQGVLESIEIAGFVSNLLSGIMKFLGRTLVVAKLTVSFIRWVLDLLFQALSTMAYMALRQANS